MPHRRLFAGLCLWIGLAALVPQGRAQEGAWQAYPALREVRAMDASAEAVWTSASGGVFAYVPATGEVTRYTPVEGLAGVNAGALAYDDGRDAVWIGYPDGVLDRLDVQSGAVTSFLDIARADQFSDRGIRRIRVHGDSLFVATAFGLVVFDPVDNEVRDTYSRLGSLEPATTVSDAAVAPLASGEAGLWLATEDGVVYAPLAGSNLQQPSAWTLDAGAPPASRCLVVYLDQLTACTGTGAQTRRADGTWEGLFFSSVEVLDLEVRGDLLLGVTSFRVLKRSPGAATTAYVVEGFLDFRALAVGPAEQLWIGDGQDGLLRLPEPGGETGTVTVEPAQVVIPEGPLLNTIADLAVGPDGTLWLAHTRPRGRTGLSRLDADGWTTYASDDPQYDLADQTYRSAFVGEDGTAYAGSFGDGLAEVTSEGVVTTYRSDNSSLQASAPTNPSYIVVGDAVTDADGHLWVTNRGAPLPVHVRTPEGTWQGLPYPPGIPSSVFLDRIAIDAFGTKWMTVRTSTGTAGLGLAAFSTGADPLDPSDDRGLHISETGAVGVGLPNQDVNALAFDLDDRLWIGTDRGLAVIFSPGSAFGGDASLVQPQWARDADGGLLLRDLNIADIAVDPAGQKWLASPAGAWLLNAEGDAVLSQFSRTNAPLLSDNVVAVAVDEATGRVYLATDGGLLSYEGEATAPVETVQELAVAPSPYRPDEHAQGVLISGLLAATTVRVLTVDGQVVATLDGRGGTVRWDGHDDRTGAVVTSGVYLVAAVSASGQGTAYGKVAVIR